MPTGDANGDAANDEPAAAGAGELNGAVSRGGRDWKAGIAEGGCNMCDCGCALAGPVECVM